MTLPDFRSDLDRSITPKLERFWKKLEERFLFQAGERGEYDDEGDAALGLDVEYFLPNICADARYRYLGENIVLNTDAKLTPANKVGNALVSHLYGGRRIHTLFTGITDPKRAFVDFERISTRDLDYVAHLRSNAEYAKLHGYKFYGTTELHTSLQTSGRNFVRELYGEPDRAASNTDILEWIGGWIRSGLMQDLIGAGSLGEAYSVLCSLPGVGPYYGYHGAVDGSLFHFTRYRHDDAFCMPGSGCKATLQKLFPTLSRSTKFPFGEAVLWLEQNQKELFPDLTFHKVLWNIEVAGQKLFPFEQDHLTAYAIEVGTCQYSVYERLSERPELIANRRCAQDPDLTPLIMRERGNPILPQQKSSVKKLQVRSTLLDFDD